MQSASDDTISPRGLGRLYRDMQEEFAMIRLGVQTPRHEGLELVKLVKGLRDYTDKGGRLRRGG